MKKLKVLFSIAILLTLLFNLTVFIFANGEVKNSVPLTVSTDNKEYHLYDSTNFETIQMNDKTYIRISSYDDKFNSLNTDYKDTCKLLAVLIICAAVLLILIIAYVK